MSRPDLPAGTPSIEEQLQNLAAAVAPSTDLAYSGEDAIVLCPAARPGIYRALNLYIADAFGPARKPILSGFRVPAYWESYIPEIESFLFSLSDELAAPEDKDTLERILPSDGLHVSHMMDSELLAFVVGEDSVTDAIARRSRAGLLANAFLTDLAEGWSYYGSSQPPIFVEPDDSTPHPGAVRWGEAR